MYTVEDIEYVEVEFDYRSWWPQAATGKPSEWRYTKDKALKFSTKDGKYHTGIPDSDGYSIWHEGNTPLGSISTDYVLGTLVCDNLKHVTDKLNKLIAHYNL
jgi:hypothetical protein